MRFEEPLGGWFTHLTWNIDLRLRGPFVRPSTRRTEFEEPLTSLATRLLEDGDALTASALEVTVLPPLAGGPRYDLALLIRAEEPLGEVLTDRASACGLPAPTLALAGRNAGRFGRTEGRDGAILLNHFAGSSTPEHATEAWKAVSQWYVDALGVDNSTLLEFDPEAPFLTMNYAVIPGRVTPFLAGQLLRPSFHRVVRRRLRESGITPLPLFARRLKP